MRAIMCDLATCIRRCMRSCVVYEVRPVALCCRAVLFVSSQRIRCWTVGSVALLQGCSVAPCCCFSLFRYLGVYLRLYLKVCMRLCNLFRYLVEFCLVVPV